jgi:threonine dehydrogenase-like Zn-dependent dehydrogenase
MLGCEEIVKALVYHGPGEKSWIDVPDPKIQNPTDIIVRIDTTTICGTYLHILKGDVPAATSGRILGHEGVGVITEVGSSVTQLARRRQRDHLVHQVVWPLQFLSAGHFRALPG